MPRYFHSASIADFVHKIVLSNLRPHFCARKLALRLYIIAIKKSKTYNPGMVTPNRPPLKENSASGGQITAFGPNSWRLALPPGPKRQYRLAQLDDYSNLPRRDFHWQPPLQIRLQARASSQEIPGTWGFGFWNDPFGLALLKGGGLRLPALPNAAWFFFASPANYLSFRNDQPAQGALTSVFQSIPHSSGMLLLLAPLFPLIFLPASARALRRAVQRLIREESHQIPIDLTSWHDFRILWSSDKVIFSVDGATISETNKVPPGKLGLVLWIDNQYAAFPPNGHLRFGTLRNPEPVWIEIKDLEIEQG